MRSVFGTPGTGSWTPNAWLVTRKLREPFLTIDRTWFVTLIQVRLAPYCALVTSPRCACAWRGTKTLIRAKVPRIGRVFCHLPVRFIKNPSLLSMGAHSATSRHGQSPARQRSSTLLGSQPSVTAFAPFPTWSRVSATSCPGAQAAWRQRRVEAPSLHEQFRARSDLSHTVLCSRRHPIAVSIQPATPRQTRLAPGNTTGSQPSSPRPSRQRCPVPWAPPRPKHQRPVSLC